MDADPRGKGMTHQPPNSIYVTVTRMNAVHRNHACRTHGILFIFSGPSGVGKDSVLRRALPRIPELVKSVSVTTRGPRPHERCGVDYFFVSPETFADMRERHEFLECAEVHGNWYGTPRPWVDEQLAAGRDVVLAIDVQGAQAVRAVRPDAATIFLVPPSLAELEHRLRRRNTEDEGVIRRRLANAREEMARAREYDFVVINECLDGAVEDFRAIIAAERCRPRHLDVQALLTEGESDG